MKTSNSKQKITKIYFFGLIVGLIFVGEYVFSAYQFNKLINTILKSENVAYSFYDNYRPRPEIGGNIKTGIFFEYTRTNGTKVISSFEIAFTISFVLISVERGSPVRKSLPLIVRVSSSSTGTALPTFTFISSAVLSPIARLKVFLI